MELIYISIHTALDKTYHCGYNMRLMKNIPTLSHSAHPWVLRACDGCPAGCVFMAMISQEVDAADDS